MQTSTLETDKPYSSACKITEWERQTDRRLSLTSTVLRVLQDIEPFLSRRHRYQKVLYAWHSHASAYQAGSIALWRQGTMPEEYLNEIDDYIWSVSAFIESPRPGAALVHSGLDHCTNWPAEIHVLTRSQYHVRSHSCDILKWMSHWLFDDKSAKSCVLLIKRYCTMGYCKRRMRISKTIGHHDVTWLTQ